MRYSAAFTLIVLALSPTLTSAQECSPACCNVLVKGADDSTVGLTCTPGGIDCGFSGQVTACCETVNTLTSVGHNCRPA
ncbi:hypothetical protein FA13DRAFT_1691165 [Coprinellus micaceus]|uniref:Hydrophobin n=1 Tax=Coprinellus micaceus TaxID=71717 RepID=A0A4Y7T1C9_COPMI|nr:hypothetical protein FA13DRAFT_1691165 [Coprinellus micaceus]